MLLFKRSNVTKMCHQVHIFNITLDFNLVTVEMCCLGISPPSQSTQWRVFCIGPFIFEGKRSTSVVLTRSFKNRFLFETGEQQISTNVFFCPKKLSVHSECEQGGMRGIHLRFNP